MVVATLCYVKKEGKVLMLHRVKKENDVHDGKWVGLGGKVEEGESPEDCIIREVKEESGLTIKNPVMKGILTFPKFLKGKTWYVFVFVATEFEGELIESNEGNLEWIEEPKLLDLNMWEGDRVFIELLDKDCFFSVKAMYEGQKHIDSVVNIYK